MDRRDFLIASGTAAATLKLMPLTWLMERSAWPASRGNETLVVIRQEGGCDGLSMIPPIGEANYFDARPTLALKATGENPVIRLDDHFGLHPSMKALKPFWDQGSLAFVHQCGSPHPSHSHFDSGDFLESGSPGLKLKDGYLNRALQVLAPDPADGIVAACIGKQVLSLRGEYPVFCARDLFILDNAVDDRSVSGLIDELRSQYLRSGDKKLRQIAQDAFAFFGEIRKGRIAPPPKTDLKANPIAGRLGQIANLIKAGVGLKVATMVYEGWDTHINHASVLDRKLGWLADGLAAFAHDLGPLFNDVCVVVVTEFGRRVKENASQGTDHGHGAVMMVFGGQVRGKNVYARWKSLRPENLFEERDLPVTTDFREVLGVLLKGHLGVPSLDEVFPGFQMPVASHPLLRT